MCTVYTAIEQEVQVIGRKSNQGVEKTEGIIGKYIVREKAGAPYLLGRDTKAVGQRGNLCLWRR